MTKKYQKGPATSGAISPYIVAKTTRNTYTVFSLVKRKNFGAESLSELGRINAIEADANRHFCLAVKYGDDITIQHFHTLSRNFLTEAV